MSMLQATQRLRRHVDRQLRRRVRAARGNPIKIIDAMFKSHALGHKLADRAIDLELAELEKQLGLEPAEPLPWPTADAPVVDNTPALRERLQRVAAALADQPSRPRSAK